MQINTIRPALTTVSPVWPALLAVALFSATAPFTSIALEQMSPLLITATRRLLAGPLAVLCIRAAGWPLPPKKLWPALLFTSLTVAVGFPYLLALSLQYQTTARVGVWLAGLPLLTAVFAVTLFRERVKAVFWLWAGVALILLLTVQSGRGGMHQPLMESSAGAALAGTLICGAATCSTGAVVARHIGGWQTICWAMAISLPLSAALFGYAWGEQTHPAGGYQTDVLLALLYLALISQWLGFRFWYSALSQGTAELAQVQLLQPLLTLLLAVWLLHETVPAHLWGLALLVILAVVMALRTRSAV